MPLIERFVTTTRGAMILAGNTLNCRQSLPYPGTTYDYVNGAYISTDSTLVATAGFPNGTTFDPTQSGSTAIINIPPGSTILFAQLFWGMYLANPPTTSEDSAITFITPAGSNTVSPDLTLKQVVTTSTWQAQDVAALVTAGGSGTYGVAGVPGFTAINDTTAIGNGWGLIIVYANPSLPLRYFNVNTGLSYAASGTPSEFTFTGFQTPLVGPIKAYFTASEINGDLNDQAQVLIGKTSSSTTPIGNSSTGTWNGASPYAQIGNMLPGNILIADTNDPDIGLLDTRGTFGTNNKDPFAGTAPAFSRINMDILGLDVSNQITNNQTSLYTSIFYAGSGAGDIMSQAIQVDTNQAILPLSKSVSQDYATVGDTLVFTIVVPNTGNISADNIVFIDTTPSGTTFIPGSVTIDGIPNPTANPNPPGGITLSTIPSSGVTTVAFSVTVDSVPFVANPVQNQASVGYTYVGSTTVITSEASNVTTTTLVDVTLTSSKTVSSAYAGIGDLLTYTIPIANSGNATATSITFIDTLPDGTVFVPNSLQQDGTAIAGNPNPPGVTLPLSIPPAGVSTITFQVQVTSVPNPNPIVNTASASAVYTVDSTTTPMRTSTATTNTNTVNTLVNVVSIPSPNKTVDKTGAAIGDTLTYSVGVTNLGNTSATNVMFTDTIPNGTTFIANSVTVNGTATPGNPETGVNMGTIPAGGTSTISFKVTVNTLPTPNPIPNQGIVNYTYTINPLTGTTGTGNAASNIVDTFVAQATINTNKTVDKANAGVGDVVTYTVVTQNTGNTTADNVLITDTVPNGTTFVPGSATVNGVPSTDSPLPGINAGSVGPGQVATVTFSVTIDTIPNPNPSINTANTSFIYTADPSVPGGQSGGSPSNPVSTKTNYAIIDSTTGGLTKAVDKPYADVGDTLTYTVTVKNTGNTTAVGVVLTDTIPTDTTFIPGTVKVNGVASGDNPQVGGVTIGNVGPNQTATVTFQVTVNTIPNPNPILNDGTINFSFVTDPSVPTSQVAAGNTNTVATTVNHANITNNDIVKTVDKTGAAVGDTLTYSVGVTNTGNTTATNVMFTDTIPNGTTFIANSVTVNGAATAGSPATGVNMGNIPAGGTSTISFKVTVNTVPTPNPIPNQGVANYTYVVNPSTGTTGAGTAASNVVDTFVALATINTTKTVDKANAGVGDVVTYTIVTQNTGNTTADNVIITDTVPNGTTFVPGSATVNGAPSGDAPVPGINAGSVGPGQGATVTFSVTIDTIPNPNPSINTANTSFIFTTDPSVPGGQSGGSPSNPVPTKTNYAIIDNTTGGLTKAVDKPYADVGDTLTYTIAIKNTGNTTAVGIVLTDTIPTDTTFIPGTVKVNGLANGDNPEVGGVNVGNVGPNQTVTVTFQVMVNTIPNPNPILNNGTLNFSFVTDPSVPTSQLGTGNTNTVATTVNHATINGDSIIKSVDKTGAAVGDTVTYTIGVGNTGNTTATNVTFKDTIPNGTTFVADSVTVNGVAVAGSPATGVNMGNIPAGGTSTISFKVVVNTVPTPNPIPNQGLVNYTYIINPSTGTSGASSGVSNVVDTFVATASIKSTKSVDKGNSGVGDVLVYTVALQNTGNTTADNVIMTDTIPSNTTFVAGSATVNGAPNGDAPQPGINAGSIGPGAVTTVSFSVTVDSIPNPNPSINTAGAEFNYTADPNFPDGQSGTSTSNPVPNKVNYAVIDYATGGLTKAVDKPYADVGDTVTYTITIKNTGNTTANNIILTDTIPTETTFIPGSATVNGVANAGNPEIGGITVGNVGANQTAIVTFKVVVNTIPNPNPILNDGTVNFRYVTDPSVPTSAPGTGHTNTVATTVNHATINSDSIIKSVDKTGAAVGDTVTYTIGVGNTGNTTATNVIFKDTIPNGTTFVANSVTVNGVLAAGSPATGVTMGNIPAGGTSTISFKVVVNTVPTPNPIPNQGLVNYTYTINPSTGSTGASSGLSNVVDTFVALAKITSTKTVDKANAGVGDVVVYTVALQNTGNTTADNVIMADTVPNGMIFIPGTATVNGMPSGDAPQPGINAGSIGPSQVTTVTFSVTIDTLPNPNPSVNTASTDFVYTADPSFPGGQKGTSPSNSVSTKTNYAVIDNATGGLTKAVDKPFADVGDTLTYTITVKNTGNTTASNVVFTDTLPTDTTFIPGSATVNGIVTPVNPEIQGVTLPNLGPNQTAIITFKVIVTTIPSPNPIPNNGTINFTFTTDPSIPTSQSGGGNTNTVFTQVNHAAISSNSITKNVDKRGVMIGDTITYTVGITNTGNTTATNVVFQDTIPNGTTFVNGSVTVNGSAVVGNPGASINIGNIPAGGTSTVSFQVIATTVPNPNPIPNQAKVSYSYVVSPSIPTTGSSSALTNVVYTAVANPKVSLTKQVDKPYATVGATLTYTLTLRNVGNVSVANLVITDTIPNDTTLVPGSVTINGVASGDDPQIGIPVGSLAPNTTTVITFEVMVNTVPTPNPIPNNATLNYTYTLNPSIPNGGAASSNSNTVTTQVNIAEVSTAKTANTAVSAPGDTITYTLAVTNTGNVTANNVVIYDTVPQGTTFVPGSVKVNGTANSGNPSTGINVGSVGAGKTSTVTFNVVVGPTLPDINPIVNVADTGFTYTVDPSVPNGGSGSTPSNPVPIQINKADLSGVTKTVDKPYAQCGDILTYTISVPNTGNVLALGVVITDTLPKGTAFVGGSVTVNGVSSPSENPATGVHVGDIPAGGVVVITYQVDVIC